MARPTIPVITTNSPSKSVNDVGFCNAGINEFDPITEVVARVKKMGVQVGILSAVDKD